MKKNKFIIISSISIIVILLLLLGFFYFFLGKNQISNNAKDKDLETNKEEIKNETENENDKEESKNETENESNKEEIKNETENENDKEESKNEDDVYDYEYIGDDISFKNDPQAQELFNLVVDRNLCEEIGPFRIFFDTGKIEELIANMSEEMKMKLIYHNLSNSITVSCKGIEPQTLPDFIVHCESKPNNAISKEKVEKIYKSAYGSNKILDTNINILFKGIAYIFNSNLNLYIEYHSNTGGTCADTFRSYITKVDRTDSEIKIYEHFYTTKYYILPNEHYNYTYTFKKQEDNTYYFYSRTIERVQ